MAKTKSKSKSSKASTHLEMADAAVLKRIEFPSETAVQPKWVGERHPEYAHDHGMHNELTTVRSAEHRGHEIKITTTYDIEIDGRAVHFHAHVGNDGQLHCHSTPYEKYVSAVDLVKELIDRFPEAFAEGGDTHGEHDAHKPHKPHAHGEC